MPLRKPYPFEILAFHPSAEDVYILKLNFSCTFLSLLILDFP